eukprot:9721556-Alexandrium_andersonii.AAC.1
MQFPIRSRPVSAEIHPNSLQAFEPGTAQAQERPQNWSPKLPRGGFCAALVEIPNPLPKRAIEGLGCCKIGG